MSDYAFCEETALDEEARHRAEEIRATDEAAAHPQAAGTGPSPAAEATQVPPSRRPHDCTDPAASQPPQPGRRRGLRR